MYFLKTKIIHAGIYESDIKFLEIYKNNIHTFCRTCKRHLVLQCFHESIIYRFLMLNRKRTYFGCQGCGKEVLNLDEAVDSCCRCVDGFGKIMNFIQGNEIYEEVLGIKRQFVFYNCEDCIRFDSKIKEH